VYPALHLQLTNVPLASGEFEFDGHDVHVEVDEEYFPAPQFVHKAFPVAVLYLPASQFAQFPPSGPVDPALHLQLANVPLAAGEFEFDGHPAQVFDAAPTAVE
jgi:hypothetical protein